MIACTTADSWPTNIADMVRPAEVRLWSGARAVLDCATIETEESEMADKFDWNEFNREVIEEFRRNGGSVGGRFAGAPMILVTHRGAKSGTPYTTPLVHTRDGDRFVVIASKGGAPDDPQWFRNVVANPDVEVEVGTERFAALASVAEGEERDRLYHAQADLMPNFDDYAKATTREIPVVVLERV